MAWLRSQAFNVGNTRLHFCYGFGNLFGWPAISGQKGWICIEELLSQ